jgi:phenylacetate-CoA ligase
VSSADQLRRLNELLVAIVPANPFYTRKLGGARLQFTSLAEFAARVPFTTKQELVADQLTQPPFGTNLTFPLDHYTRFHQTSGTSGAPLRWLDTPASWRWLTETWAEVYRAAGVNAGDRVYFAFSFGPFIGFWMAFDAAQQLGCLCLPGGGLSSAARLRAMLDTGATVLCCTPTYALRLGEVAAEEKIDLNYSNVRLIIVAGEPGGSVPATRARISLLWHGARVFDHHGLTEVGPVTHETPDRPGSLTVIESSFIAEVVDGELVVTNLGRLGSPLLRYRTGDQVKPVTVNSRLVLEGGILGRVDDMVIVRGVNIFPSAVDEVLRRFNDLAEYRVDVARSAALTELRVQIEPTADCLDPHHLRATVERFLQTAFALRIPVTLLPHGTLPRFEMKARRWIVTSS